MKTLITCFALLYCAQSISQVYVLPYIEEGTYLRDTIDYKFTTLPNSGIGYISTNFSDPFITGIQFKICIDSIDQAGSPSHSASKDSAGIWVPVYKGEELTFPVSLQLFTGQIGFYIVMEGTPQNANEAYQCRLQTSYSLGNNYGIYISEDVSSDTCTVASISNLAITKNSLSTTIFPNPFFNSTTLVFDNPNHETFQCKLLNMQGQEIRRISKIKTDRCTIQRDGLSPGTYVYHLQNSKGAYTTGKLIVMP